MLMHPLDDFLGQLELPVFQIHQTENALGNAIHLEVLMFVGKKDHLADFF
jgi:hypothetical protein